MSQLRSSTSSIPSDLRVDLSEIVEDLLAFHYDDICSSLSDNSGFSGPNSSTSTLATSGSNTADLVRRISRMRSNIQRAQEAARKLSTCDLDVPAQEKLLLAILGDEIPSELIKIFDSFTSIDKCSLNTSEEMQTTSSAIKTLTSDELSCRREKIIKLFSLNHLNEVSVNDREEVVIHNVVFIKPPYNIDCCSGKNMIILDRVKNLIERSK
uniref:AD domain-containing protein n=1 Tax=Schistosoma haematobium TaxID=6185 RepID=A0A095C8E8_SCHHA